MPLTVRVGAGENRGTAVALDANAHAFERPTARALDEDGKADAAQLATRSGFLAAGLVYGLVPGPSALEFQVFFLSCVIVAGVFGAITAQRSILFVQALPGAVALALVLLGR